MYHCPICHEPVLELTKKHCELKHSMSKEEVVSIYGKPEFKQDFISHQVRDWITATTPLITKGDFALPQSAVRSVQKEW